MSMDSRLGGHIWNLIPLGFCREAEKSVRRVEEGFRDVVSDDFYRVFSGKGRYCERIKFFL